MLQFINQPVQLKWHTQEVTIPVQLTRMILVAVGLAVAWWAFAYYLYLNDSPFKIWVDQEFLFLRTNQFFYTIYSPGMGYFNAPWSMLILAPFNVIPVPLAILLQMIILFVTIALIIYKFSWLELTFEKTRNPLLSQQAGRARPHSMWLTLLLVLTSPIALDNAVELNLEWIAIIGLIVPVRYSLIFLTVKPTIAFGYVFSFRWRQLFQAGVAVLIVLLISFLIWGFWIPDYIESAQQVPPQSYNVTVAPVHHFGWVPSVAIGIALAAYAFLKRDGLLGVLAGFFFVPYIAGYSILVHCTLLTVRWRWVGVAFYIATWAIVGLIIAG